MALVKVKSKKAPHFETEVDEEWLTRWPDDFDLVDKKATTGSDYPAPIDQQPGGNPAAIDQTNR